MKPSQLPMIVVALLLAGMVFIVFDMSQPVKSAHGSAAPGTVGAAIEQGNDERGIVLPASIAPFTLAICPIGADRSAAVKEAAEKLYADCMAAGIDVLLDDRGERPGAMFADMELIGIPHRITIGDRGLKEGKVEYQGRRDAAATAVAIGEVAALLAEKLKA